MTFTETNLRKGLETFITKTTIKRQVKAIETYHKEVDVDNVEPRTAIEHALEQAVRELKDEKALLKTARQAAGLTLKQRAQATTGAIMTRANKPAKSKTTKTKTQKVHTSRRLSDSDNYLIATTVAGFLIGVLLAVYVVYPFGDWAYTNWLTNNTGLWPEWFTVPVTILIFTLFGYLFATRPGNRKDEKKTTVSTKSGSAKDLGLDTP